MVTIQPEQVKRSPHEFPPNLAPPNQFPFPKFKRRLGPSLSRNALLFKEEDKEYLKEIKLEDDIPGYNNNNFICTQHITIQINDMN